MRRTPSPLWPLLCLLLLLGAACCPGTAAEDRWAVLDQAAQEAVAAGNVPGVVFLVGSHGKIVYRKAFGNRSVQPEKTPMTVDTVFDLASLTKVIATTSSVMALIEDGKLRLNDPVATYWPEFGANGKEKVTLRHLLTHTSGLPSFVNYFQKFGDANTPGVQQHTEQVTAAIAAMPLSYPTDTKFVYSDLGFISLGEVVRRVSGEPLDRFAAHRIFRPLGMRESGFNPTGALRERAAPTEKRAGQWLKGDVHDPNAAVCGGVAGHAGLFSTADDLAHFAAMLLSSDPGRGARSVERASGTLNAQGPTPDAQGRMPNAQRPTPNARFPLGPATVRLMTTPHTPAGLPVRGLGWDIDSPYSHVRGDLMPLGSFGHTGFTGTYIWVDPYSQSFIIGLSNRVHPDGKGSPLRLWARAANIMEGIVRPQSLPARPELLPSQGQVLTGLDVLQRDGFEALRGRKVGLITNRTGVNRERVSAVDLLHEAKGVELRALFAPEHGIRSELDEFVASSRDEKTGLPVYSLYGRGRYKPLAEELQGLDTLVFDIQDIGVRYYTYITTLGLAMEAAAENKLRFVVLDRPNPINGVTVDGPLLEPSLRSFSGYYRLPVRHGMTVGELARLYNEEFGIHCDLKVIPIQGWRRAMWFEQTGLPWTDPSPNIRNTVEAELYPGIGLLERANLSVGRGTDTPFIRFGAPWVDGSRLAAELNRCRLPGLVFVPVSFKPASSVYKDEVCGGVDVRLMDREAFQGCRTAIEILDALVRLYPQQAKIERTGGMFGTDRIPREILAGRPVSDIVASYAQDVRAFRELRTKYLLYQ